MPCAAAASGRREWVYSLLSGTGFVDWEGVWQCPRSRSDTEPITRRVSEAYDSRRLREIERRLKPGGKYEMATLEMREIRQVNPTTVRPLTQAAVKLNETQGNLTEISMPATALSSRNLVGVARRDSTYWLALTCCQLPAIWADWGAVPRPTAQETIHEGEPDVRRTGKSNPQPGSSSSPSFGSATVSAGSRNSSSTVVA